MLSHLVGTGFTIAQLVVSLTGIALIYGIYKIYAFIHDKVTSPIRDVPGPSNPSFLYGNFEELLVPVSSYRFIMIIALSMHSKKNGPMLQESWLDQYGPTIQFKGPLSVGLSVF